MEKEFFETLFYSLVSFYPLKILIIVAFLVVAYLVLGKVNEAKWKAFIPFYNAYLLFKIVWKPLVFWIYLSIMLLAPVLILIACYVFVDEIMLFIYMLYDGISSTTLDILDIILIIKAIKYLRDN